MTVQELFEKHSNEYLHHFERVENKRSNRPDLHAFILLDELFPSSKDMISSSTHDEYYLCISEEEIETLTEDQVIELTRCGVRYDPDGCLSMFA